MTKEQAILNLRFADHLENIEEDEFNILEWGTRGVDCGTIACVAGHAVLWSGYNLNPTWIGYNLLAKPNGGWEPVDYAAKRAMGLTKAERDELFHWGGYDVTNQHRVTPKMAAEKLREIVRRHHKHVLVERTKESETKE